MFEFFLNGAELSLNSVILENSRESQFRDPVSHKCLGSAVLAPWSLMQEMTDYCPFIVMTHIFVTKFAEFS